MGWELAVATLLVGVVLVRAIALRKGISVGPYVLLAIFVAVVAVPAVLLTRSNPDHAAKPFWTLPITVGLMAYVMLFGAAILATFIDINTESHTTTVDTILSGDARSNTLRVSYLNLPWLAGIPLIGPSTYAGYFTVRETAGEMPKECTAQTFDFTGRVVGSSYSVQIDGMNMMRLARCN